MTWAPKSEGIAPPDKLRVWVRCGCVLAMRVQCCGTRIRNAHLLASRGARDTAAAVAAMQPARLAALLLALLPSVAGQQPPASDAVTKCDTCTDPNVQKTGWWHGVGLNCPTGGDQGDCDICAPQHGNSPEVVSACQTAATEAACCQICTMWNDRRLPGGLAPGNDRLCASWYWRKEGAKGWCGLKDCAGPGQCGPAATSADYVSGPACGTKAFGWAFVSVTLGALAVYVGGGTLYGWQVVGKPPHWESHPHHMNWVSVGGLVVDGLAFTASGGKRRRAANRPSSSGEGAPAKERLVAEEEPESRQSPKKKEEKTKEKRPENKTKEKKRVKRAKETPADSGSERADPWQGVAAAEAAAASTASGGGGRWVHVPT